MLARCNLICAAIVVSSYFSYFHCPHQVCVFFATQHMVKRYFVPIIWRLERSFLLSETIYIRVGICAMLELSGSHAPRAVRRANHGELGCHVIPAAVLSFFLNIVYNKRLRHLLRDVVSKCFSSQFAFEWSLIHIDVSPGSRDMDGNVKRKILI